MLACSCYFNVFLLLPNIIFSQGESMISNVIYNKTNQHNLEETIFTDVIKNISRVNNVLQELIQNYEHIQKMYETKSFENDYSTDIEIDEDFKDKYNKKPRTSEDNKKSTIKSDYAGTVMIQSEDSKSETEDSEKEIKIDEKTVPEILNLQATKTLTTGVALVDSLNVEFHANKSSEENSKKFVTVPTEMTSLDDDVFIFGRTNHKVEKKTTKSKTDATYKNVKKNVKKIIYTETFPQGRIWDEIANKKPIHLRTYNVSTPHKNVQNISFKSRGSPKTAVVIVTKNNERQSEQSSSEYDSEDLDLGIDKQAFKANVLRDDNGNACMKMVVRKCYKACKQTSKIVCKMFKCQSSYKEKFLSSAKTACIKKFTQPWKTKNKEKTSTERKIEVNAARASDGDLDFLDATRQGFPAKVCYPFMRDSSESQEVKGKRASTKPTTVANKRESKRPILRDRYEKACRKASSDKCESACLHAHHETCATYSCGKGTKKGFKKHCRTQCKIVYKFSSTKSKSSDSSSSSSSSTSSSSDSDSDSDSDGFSDLDFL